MDPPSFTGSCIKEDLENIIEVLKELFDVMIVDDAERFWLVVY